RVDSLPPLSKPAHLLDTVGGPGSLDVYLAATGLLFFDVEGTTLAAYDVLDSAYGGDWMDTYYGNRLGQHVGHGMMVYDNGQRLGQWIHYTFYYHQGAPGTASSSELYADYGLPGFESQYSQLTYTAQEGESLGVRVGPGTVGHSANSTPFHGQIDEVVLYSGYDIHNGYGSLLQDTYSGTYDNGVLPRFLLTFEPEAVQVSYADHGSGSGHAHASCDSHEACPAVEPAGVFGSALSFDGIDDALQLEPWQFAQGDYTIAGWFKTSHGSYQRILGAMDVNGGPDAPPAISIG